MEDWGIVDVSEKEWKSDIGKPKQAPDLTLEMLLKAFDIVKDRPKLLPMYVPFLGR